MHHDISPFIGHTGLSKQADAEGAGTAYLLRSISGRGRTSAAIAPGEQPQVGRNTARWPNSKGVQLTQLKPGF